MIQHASILAFIGPIGGTEMIVILVVALLIFGRRLPEVGKSLGKGIVEFKKGIQGIEDDLDHASTAAKSNDAAGKPDAPTEPARLDSPKQPVDVAENQPTHASAEKPS